jgi:drug/metabolite transporter (DMT)-like permease
MVPRAKTMSIRASSDRHSGYFFAGLAAAGWGVWPWVLARAEAGGSISPALEGLFQLAIMTLFTAPFAFKNPLPRRLAPWIMMTWLGISDVGNVLCFFSAYQHTSVAIAVLTHYLAPLLVALFSPMFTGEKFEERTLVAAAVSFLGLITLLEPWRGTLRSEDLVGAGLGAMSALFYASNVIVQKRTSTVFSAPQVLFFHGLVAVPLLLLRVPSGGFAALKAPAMLWLSAGSLILGVGCGVLFLVGLKRIRASHASMLTLMEPLVAVILGAALLGQALRPLTIVGGFLVLGSAAWIVGAGPAKPSP